MIPAPFKVVLDACVLYPFTVRDVLLQAAAQGFYQVYWSETILDEALRNLISDGRMTEDNAAKLVAAMRRAFPEAQVTDHEALIPAMRNDEKDRHVAAAAVKAGAQVIVTSNTRDFYDLPSGIDVQTPAGGGERRSPVNRYFAGAGNAASAPSWRMMSSWAVGYLALTFFWASAEVVDDATAASNASR